MFSPGTFFYQVEIVYKAIKGKMKNNISKYFLSKMDNKRIRGDYKRDVLSL